MIQPNMQKQEVSSPQTPAGMSDRKRVDVRFQFLNHLGKSKVAILHFVKQYHYTQFVRLQSTVQTTSFSFTLGMHSA